MKRGAVALLTLSLLFSGCKGKSIPVVPATPTPSPFATTVNVVLTFQGVYQPGVLVTESAGYTYATGTPSTALQSGTTNASGAVTLSVGAPNVQYCFSANYTPAGQASPIKVVDCQPSISIGQTITLGN
ncbi:MAG: hypothetical protein ABR584_04320 [Candidatus Baltobacteraceae bacterium]